MEEISPTQQNIFNICICVYITQKNCGKIWFFFVDKKAKANMENILFLNSLLNPLAWR
jgi:hypothetical protein